MKRKKAVGSAEYEETFVMGMRVDGVGCKANGVFRDGHEVGIFITSEKYIKKYVPPIRGLFHFMNSFG